MHKTVLRLALPLAAALTLAACGGGTKKAVDTAPPSGIYVAASINTWGSILSQLGGDKVKTTSIITNPNTDPHDYEPTPADAVVVAQASLWVENGVGYDDWADKAFDAANDPAKSLLNLGSLLGVADGGNPHLWYSPANIEKVADTMTVGLQRLDLQDSAYFTAQRKVFETSLTEYHSLINDIKTKYKGVKVGASESIFAPLASALGLDLVTPANFLKDISEGSDPSPADVATINKEISSRSIKVYVFNSQNATPDVQAQVAAAKAEGIPVVPITETLSPVNATFQDWQVTQLKALETALAAPAN